MKKTLFVALSCLMTMSASAQSWEWTADELNAGSTTECYIKSASANLFMTNSKTLEAEPNTLFTLTYVSGEGNDTYYTVVGGEQYLYVKGSGDIFSTVQFTDDAHQVVVRKVSNESSNYYILVIGSTRYLYNSNGSLDRTGNANIPSNSTAEFLFISPNQKAVCDKYVATYKLLEHYIGSPAVEDIQSDIEAVLEANNSASMSNAEERIQNLQAGLKMCEAEILESIGKANTGVEGQTKDASALIPNASFEAGNVAWTFTSGAKGDDTKITNDSQYATEGMDGDYIFNTWKESTVSGSGIGAGSETYYEGSALEQTISLPNGRYILEAKFSTELNGTVYLTVNGEKVASVTMTDHEYEKFETASYELSVTDETLTLGAVGEERTATGSAGTLGSEKTVNYTIPFRADDFRLTYLGEEETKLTLGETGMYTTFCAPYDVQLGENVTAYGVEVQPGAAVLVELDLQDNVLTANTPAILTHEGEIEEVTLYGPVAKDQVTDGALVGIVGGEKEDRLVPAGSYVLQNHGGKYAFYVLDKNAYGVKNRCYLTTPVTSVKTLDMIVGSDETAISAVSASKANEALYDLSGRKISKAQKGIYIKNGKKVSK